MLATGRARRLVSGGHVRNEGRAWRGLCRVVAVVLIDSLGCDFGFVPAWYRCVYRARLAVLWLATMADLRARWLAAWLRFLINLGKVLSFAVYASQPGSPRDHARLATGWWLASTGRDWLPAGLLCRFRLCLH